MHNRDKYPEIFAALEKAREEEAVLLEAIAPGKEKIVELTKKIDALRKQKSAEWEKIEKDYRPALVEVRERISSLAIAMGGRTLSGR